jgi:hypothetical protein
LPRLERAELAADGPVGHALDQAREDELGQQVLPVGGGVGRVGQRPWDRRSRTTPSTAVPPRVQESQRHGTLSDQRAGIAPSRQESRTSPPASQAGRLSRDDAKAELSNARTNSQLLQHWTQNLPARLAVHTQGRGARLVEVVTGHGIGFVLARTWPGDRYLERALKRRRMAPRYCPICRAARRRR